MYHSGDRPTRCPQIILPGPEGRGRSPQQGSRYIQDLGRPPALTMGALPEDGVAAILQLQREVSGEVTIFSMLCSIRDEGNSKLSQHHCDWLA